VLSDGGGLEKEDKSAVKNKINDLIKEVD